MRLAAAENARVNDSTENSDEAERIKSAISIVQEVAQKRDLPIRFAVKSENGPAHMKHFVITCSVGEMTVRTHFHRSCIYHTRLIEFELLCFLGRRLAREIRRKWPKNMLPRQW